MKEQLYTISVYTENNVGLLNRIATIFLKRHINIESLNVSRSEIEDVSRFNIVTYITEDQAKVVTKQIEKQIEVIKAYYHTDDETIFQETAIYKIASDLLFDQREIQNIIKDSHAEIVTVARDFFVISKTGRRQDTEDLYNQLKPYGIMQFVRSGRISVSKNKMEISELLTNI
ncbi:MAG: acetolactate synthase small subunit [Vicingus serpentipes]|nr:acetolactate synthase small subunit [Vicingus serpentipes]